MQHLTSGNHSWYKAKEELVCISEPPHIPCISLSYGFMGFQVQRLPFLMLVLFVLCISSKNKYFVYFCCHSSLDSQADQAIHLIGILFSIIHLRVNIKACKGHNGFGGLQTFLMFLHTALLLLYCLKHFQSFR